MRSDGVQHKPLLGHSYPKRLLEWEEGKRQWARGLRFNYAEEKWVLLDDVGVDTWEEWEGDRPDPDDYMPDWPEAERTHYQMYETCSEGTPISPVTDSPEKLACWLADHGASAFAGMTATYEQWLAMIDEGSSVSMVVSDGRLMSGVEAIGEDAGAGQ